MTTTSAAFPDLFPEAHALFHEIVGELADYGIEISPTLEVRRVTATLSYYDYDDGHIYLGLPNPAQPVGKLLWVMGRTLWGCETDDDLARFLRLFVPRLLAHEIGHHLRQRYGRLTADRWHEEQVANQLATAIMNRRLSHDERVDATRIVRRALDRSGGADGQVAAAATYHDVIGAMSVEGMMAPSTVNALDALQRALSLTPQQLLQGRGALSDDVIRVLAGRGDAIEHINTDYVSNQMQYMNYHLGWLYYDLTSRRTETIDEFARVHLGLGDPLVTLPSEADPPSPAAIRACHDAHVRCADLSPTASRYFYKRYRSLLIAMLRAATIDQGPATAHLDGWIESLLEGWSDDARDTLDFLVAIVPPDLQHLLPNRITEAGDGPVSIDASLPTDVDRRVWRHVALGADDPGVANSLARLRLLDRSEVFAYLPADVLLRIAANLNRVHFRAGDTVVWEGDQNSDMYLAIEGELAVCRTVGGKRREIGPLHAGDVFGEMAFFTGDPRSATVRARTAAVCFVLAAADLRAMVYEHPVIVMRMARVLAKRLEVAGARATDDGIRES